MTIKEKASNAIQDAKLILDRGTEKQTVKAARELQEQIQAGALEELAQIQLVDTYMQLAAAGLAGKERIRIRVQLIKTPKKQLIEMLDTVAKNIISNH